MSAISLKFIRGAALAAALSALPFAASAKDASSAPADPTNQTLQAVGWLPVKAAGPYVELGSFRIWVRSHLGRPAAILPDGTWIYKNFAVDGSGASGALLISFSQGRVSDLRLVTPTVLTALLSHPQTTKGSLVAQAQTK